MAKFNATMYVTAYELARDGFADDFIGRSLGVTGNTFKNWCRRKPALADAVSRGRGVHNKTGETAFHEYIYMHLSPDLQDLWDQIHEFEKEKNGVERTRLLLANNGKETMQRLFIHALTQSGFNASRALRKIGIPRKRFINWCRTDPDFAELIDEVEWHQKNFFEHAFVTRVAAGDTSAVIHAVKTKCRDRGYNEKIEIEHTGTINHQHTISIAQLNLDTETLGKILIAVRKHKQITKD
jgi:hypothetical protein